MGSALGDGWSAKGHSVVYGSRSGKDDKNTGRRFATIRDAIAQSEVVVLAVPWDAVEPVLKANSVAGKIVVDATNPIGPGFELALGQTTSGGETVADLAKGAAVVKAFNTTGAGNMRNPQINGTSLTMFYAGDDGAANATVRQLVSDIGFEPVDAGPLKHARYLEPLAMLWITQSLQIGRDFAMQLIRR